MKTKNILQLLLIATIVAISSTAPAQVKRLLYSQSLESFAGTWQYASGGEVFRIVLVKGTLNESDAYGDYLIGGYYYSKNGVVVYDCTHNIPTVYTDDSDDFYTGPAISGTNGTFDPQVVTPNEARLWVSDYIYDKLGRAFVTLQNATTIHFELREVWGKEPDWPDGFSIPTNVVLTKVVPPPPLPPPSNPGKPEDPQEQGEL